MRSSLSPLCRAASVALALALVGTSGRAAATGPVERTAQQLVRATDADTRVMRDGLLVDAHAYSGLACTIGPYRPRDSSAAEVLVSLSVLLIALGRSLQRRGRPARRPARHRVEAGDGFAGIDDAPSRNTLVTSPARAATTSSFASGAPRAI